MNLPLTPEADGINVQAMNMGRIVVDVDGVNFAELINVACDNGYSLRVVDESDRAATDCMPPSAALTGIRCSTHISRKQTTPGCTRCRIRRVTPANQNGFILQAADICYVPMRGHTRFCGLNAWACQNVPSSGCHSHPALWRQSHSSGCQRRMSAGFTHFRLVIRTKDMMKLLTTETALDILIAWLQDNIDCESEIIFDNDEDKTDSAALLPCIEQAREDIRILRQLQFLQQNR